MKMDADAVVERAGDETQASQNMAMHVPRMTNILQDFNLLHLPSRGEMSYSFGQTCWQCDLIKRKVEQFPSTAYRHHVPCRVNTYIGHDLVMRLVAFATSEVAPQSSR